MCSVQVFLDSSRTESLPRPEATLVESVPMMILASVVWV